MRILHISKFSYLERGGIETFVKDVSSRQSSQGHHITVLCHHSRPGIPTAERMEGDVRVVQAAITVNLSFAPISLPFPRILKRLLRQERPDVIHLHLPNPAVLFLYSVADQFPLVIHWHADVQGQGNRAVNLLYPAYRFFEHRCLAKAGRIVTTSAKYGQASPSLAKWRGKCKAIPLGIDASRYPETPGLPKITPPVILSVGRFTYYKGYQHLVRAAALVPEARFCIVGSGPQYVPIKELVHNLGLADRVALPGAVNDAELQRLLQCCFLFCLPSVDRGEAFGIVQLEAMRYGLPLVSTAIPGSGVDWVNQDGVTGIVVPPASPEALAEAIRELLGTPGKAASMGRSGRQRYAEHFTIATVAEALEALYSEVAE